MSAPTIRLKDVAERAGVAVSTVSMALKDHPAISNATKHRVRKASQEVGYRVPARRRGTSAKQAQSGIQRVGFVVLGGPAEDVGYATLAFQVAQVAAAADIRVEISSVLETGDESAVLDALMRVAQEVDALLLTGVLPVGVAMKLLDTGVRALVLGQLQDAPETQALSQRISHIDFDSQAMGDLAACLLLDRGHRRIGFACRSLYPGLMHDVFRDGHRLALLRQGVVPAAELEQVNTTMAEAAAHFAAMAEPPTAYVVPNVPDAANLVAELRDRGVDVPLTELVVGDCSDVAARYQLGECPRVCGSMADLATLALRALQWRLDETPALAMAVPTTITNV